MNPFAPTNWQLAHGRTLTLGPKAQVMGILNVTPDSFSDGGRFVDIDTALDQARAMVEQGASIIDVGGESTRPGADVVDGKTERARVLPVIETIADKLDVAISIDTYRADTAKAAVAAGAHIVNDVWGCQREPAIAEVAARTGAGLVIMHTSRERDVTGDVMADQVTFLRRSLDIAAAADVGPASILLDPGIGFGKDADANWEILARLEELMAMSHHLLIGTSRKRFLGELSGHDADQRDAATAATSVLARKSGAAVFRVHDVASNVDALAVADAWRERELA
ncbi:dihydropteroate synthase [Ahrensia sp. R2A130]|uniref:dihydropteroate synthase n=1 Tax=Ahrensia sp. R2A130 TaxID=744979 RepID=UPI0001E0F066|nr:dihydropteroate synthase [Ahrensia sp. R2A130]EFL90416.1 dihydropteroate synthase [Ahrensia sp. R2A130]